MQGLPWLSKVTSLDKLVDARLWQGALTLPMPHRKQVASAKLHHTLCCNYNLRTIVMLHAALVLIAAAALLHGSLQQGWIWQHPLEARVLDPEHAIQDVLHSSVRR